MRTMKNAVQELVVEADASWMASSGGVYGYSELDVEPAALADWAGIKVGRKRRHLVQAAPREWQEVAGKDGGTIWYRGVPASGGGVLLQIARMNPAVWEHVLDTAFADAAVV